MSHSLRIKDLTPKQPEQVRGGWWGRVLGNIINPQVGTRIGGAVGGQTSSEAEDSA